MLLQVRNVSKFYGAVTVLDDVSFVLNAGERTGLVGPNGVGKSTLLKILIGQESADSGSFAFAPSTEVGYLPQTMPEFYGHTMQDLILESVGNLRQLEERMRELEVAMTIAGGDRLTALMEEYALVSGRFEDRGGYELDHVDSARIGYLPQDPEMDLTKTVIETYRYGQVGYEAEFVGRLIGYGLFRLEDMQKKAGQLSAGQRRKLEIARLMAEGPNVLLLDEPTNYISLDVLEAFETAILTFPGPVIAVSHDRWFMQRFGGRVWELCDGKIVREQ